MFLYKFSRLKQLAKSLLRFMKLNKGVKSVFTRTYKFSTTWKENVTYQVTKCEKGEKHLLPP